MKKYPKAFLDLLKSIQGKRPKTVIDHILKYGQITTEELKEKYGYNHPPRAIRDVREQGIPLTMFRIASKDGRKIAAYKFGSLKDIRATQLSGRTVISAQIRKKLIEKHGAFCNIYMKKFPTQQLQVDHRIPFEIAGESMTLSEDADNYMLLSPSANRAKSWSCENCANWKNRKVVLCRTCYWAFPENYQHIALQNIRRIDVVWLEKEISDYEVLASNAKKARKPLPTYVKEVLKKQKQKK